MRVNKGVEISSEAPSTPEVSTDETVLLIENYPPSPLYFPTYFKTSLTHHHLEARFLFCEIGTVS